MRPVHNEAIKLFNNIQKYGGTNAAREITFGVPLDSEATKEKRAEWVFRITKAMEENLDEATIKNIRCGCYCNEDGKLEESRQRIKGLYESSHSMEDFVSRMNESGSGWYLENGVLHTKYTSCSCPMLEAVYIMDTKTWCYCTVGYNKAIFETVFGCDIDVELLQSIKMGHEQCLMRIVPLGPLRPIE